jgi:hypothetical protein
VVAKLVIPGEIPNQDAMTHGVMTFPHHDVMMRPHLHRAEMMAISVMPPLPPVGAEGTHPL